MIGQLFGYPIGQSWEDLAAWENFLNEFTHFKRIIELGTFYGSMSRYLLAQCSSRQMDFRTYDHKDYGGNYIPYHFAICDVIKDAPMVIKQLEDRSVILFCDNGNKPLEVSLYQFCLSDESAIAVHDWQSEFFEKDIPEGWRIAAEGGATIFLMKDGYLNARGAAFAMRGVNV